MKTLTSLLLTASTLLANTAAAPSPSTIYTLKISAQGSKLDGSAVVVKDESSANTFPNPLGSFSTGNPRYPYNFTVATVSEKDNLYEIKSTVSQKHAILNGNPIAPQLFETPIGGDPAATPGKAITRTRFLILNDHGALYLKSAEDTKNADGKFDGAGSWRACNGSTVDYQLYWFNGLSNLTAILGSCEAVKLMLEEVRPSVSSTVAPATTLITSGHLTGVPAPTTATKTLDCDVSAGTLKPTSILPVPSPTSSSLVTMRIFNDQTGANAEASIPADGIPHSVSDLFRGKAVDNKGNILGTSAQLVKFSDSTKCSLVNLNVRDWVFELDGRARNFVDLDEDTSKAIPVWLNGFTFQCRQA